MRFAAPRLLFGLVAHGSDDAGRALERDADAIPHSPRFCQALEQLLVSQQALVSAVPKLGPYASLSARDPADCRAGRPYTRPAPAAASTASAFPPPLT